jgi:hypothetical protein
MTVRQQSFSEAWKVISKLSAVAAAGSVLLALSSATEAKAQNKPLACQFTAAGGLEWEQGQWIPRNFNVAEPFVLVLRDGVLDPKSVEKPLGTQYAVCSKSKTTLISCRGEFGQHLIFNPNVNQGAVSQLFGSLVKDDTRSSLRLSPFICQPY